MARRLIISMLDLLERPLGQPGWSKAVTRSNAPEQKRLEALLLDPDNGWAIQRLDLRYPGDAEEIDCGEFVVSEVGDINGDGRPEVVFAVTPTDKPSYLLAYRYNQGEWTAEPVYRDFKTADFIRSVALGDLDGDGCDEIVIGTRPDGASCWHLSGSRHRVHGTRALLLHPPWGDTKHTCQMITNTQPTPS